MIDNPEDHLLLKAYFEEILTNHGYEYGYEGANCFAIFQSGIGKFTVLVRNQRGATIKGWVYNDCTINITTYAFGGYCQRILNICDPSFSKEFLAIIDSTISNLGWLDSPKGGETNG